VVKDRLPALLVIVLTAGLGLAHAAPASASASVGATALPASADPTEPTTGPCAYTPAPDEPAARPVPLPPGSSAYARPG